MVERREILGAIGVEIDAIVFGHPDPPLRAYVDPRQEVVVTNRVVVRFEPDDDGNVGLQAGVEANAPAQRPSGSRPASRDHDRYRHFAVDGEQISGGINSDDTSERFDARDCRRDDVWVASACRSEGWRLDAQPRAATGRTEPHGGLDLAREPLVVIVRVEGRRLLVVDRGSPLGDERSLGLLLPRNQSMSDGALAVAARKACVAIDGSWRSPKAALPSFAPNFVVRGVARPLDLWNNPAAYAGFMRRRIASALGL